MNIVNDPVILMKNKLARRGYDMDDSKELLKKRKGDLIYLKKRKISIDDLKRFC